MNDRHFARNRFVGAVIAMLTSVCGLSVVSTAQSLTTGPRLMVQSGPQTLVSFSLVMSSDGRLLASTGDKERAVWIWEVATGRLLCTVPAELKGSSSLLGSSLPGMTFSTDGNSLATAVDQSVEVWDLRNCSRARRITLTPSISERVTALSTLSTNKVLMLTDGHLFTTDLFGGNGQLALVSTDGVEISALLGHSANGQWVLASSRTESTGIALPQGTLSVYDVANKTADPLSDYRGARAAVDTGISGAMAPSATISASGRYIVANHSGRLTLYDRSTRSVAAQINLDGAAASATGQAPTQQAPRPVMQIDERTKAQMEAMQRMLPPEQAAKMKAQLEAVMQGAQGPLPNVANLQSSSAIGALAIPAWVGFTPDERNVLSWRSAALNPSAGDSTEDQRGGRLELRRLSDLQLIRTIDFKSSLTANQLDALVASSFARSPDGKSLALAAANLSGGKFAVVDLSQAAFPLHAWTPSHGVTNAVAWASDAQLVTVHSQQLVGVASASASRAIGGLPAMGMPGASADPTKAISSHLVRWELLAGDIAERAIESGIMNSPLALSSQGGFAAFVTIGQDPRARFPVHVLDTKTSQVVRQTPLSDMGNDNAPNVTAPRGIAISPDGKLIAALWPPQRTGEPRPTREERRNGPRGRVLIHDAATGRALSEHAIAFSTDLETGNGKVLRFSADGRAVIVVGERREALLIDIAANNAHRATAITADTEIYGVLDGNPLRLVLAEGRGRGELATGGVATLRLKERDPVIAASANGSLLATAEARSSAINLYSVSGAAQLSTPRSLQAHAAAIQSLVFSPDARYLASTGQDGATFIWDVQQAKWIVRLHAFADGTWAVIDPQGRFDTNKLENVEQLHWILPDDPLHALPLDIFMRDYFEPRLLSRILAGERFSPVRDLSALNLSQPLVQIVKFERSVANAGVDVTVAVTQTKNRNGEFGGVSDVRLFRDGKLVASAPENAGAVQLDGRTQSAQLKFNNIKLPVRGGSIAFSAYAFNRDRIKSATAFARYDTPKTEQKGRAYVVSIGVNSHDNAAWDLSFAANDARRAQQTLTQQLTALNEFSEVVSVPLIADGANRMATKANVRAVLAALAGKGDPNALNAMTNGNRLQTATPDDLVLITFSGHGFTNTAGDFHLLPSDTGNSSGRSISDELARRSITTNDLASWLRNVDAGEIAMVIDACQSAASVEQGGFKPGPMGSKGLGQLAYDKGIRILAASQSDNFALEARELRHGLLTHALLNDGIANRRADFSPTDNRIGLSEWLEFGVRRVPELYLDIRNRKLVATSNDGRGMDRVEPPTSLPTTNSASRVQEPKLFDFHRSADDPVISRY